MNLTALGVHNREVRALVGAATTTQVESAVAALAAQEQWELLGLLLVTAAEAGARRIVRLLIDRQKYEPLAWAACLRRHLRPSIVAAVGRGLASRVFRDIDAEEDTAGVPEHILADINDLAATADQQRETAQYREAQLDRCPIRTYIVEQLARHLNEPPAREVMLTIARGSAWEETRREAALKLANHQPSLQALLAARRSADLIAVSNSASLQAVAANVAEALGGKLAELREAGDRDALAFVAENHRDSNQRQAARQALT